VRTVAEFKEGTVGGARRGVDFREGLKKITGALRGGYYRGGSFRAAGVEEGGGGEDDKFVLVTVSFLPVLAVRNLLPCALSFSFLLDGDDAPLPGYQAASGQLLAVHDFGLSRKVSIGLAIAGLEEASEFVPVFCPGIDMCIYVYM